jgi:hypothetical protein
LCRTRMPTRIIAVSFRGATRSDRAASFANPFANSNLRDSRKYVHTRFFYP